MNIVHLSNDEKFLPLAKSLFEEAFPGQNRYLLARRRRGTRGYVAPAPDISHHGSLRFRTGCVGLGLASADCLVLHLMSSRFVPALRWVRPDCLVVWLSGGGDYMPLLEASLGGLLMPRTTALLRSLDRGPPQAGPQGPWARLRAGAARSKPVAPEHPAVVQVAQRIDVFSANPADAALLRQALPTLRARLHVIPSFTVEDIFAAGALPMAGPDVLLGNSASPNNNHLEALDLLGSRLPPNTRVVAPLSYGKGHPAYARAVAECGRAALGERFEPLDDWMPIERYNQRTSHCGFVFMNHRRQQAVGNISAAFYRGASVYMRRENPLFGFFAGLGLTLHAIETLEGDPAAPLQVLTPEQRLHNRRAIEARYGRARVVAAIRALQDFRQPGAPSALCN
jgi:hypothetical protein